MWDTNTNKDRPRAVSRPVNMSRIIGTMLAGVKWVFKIVTVSTIKIESCLLDIVVRI